MENELSREQLLHLQQLAERDSQWLIAIDMALAYPDAKADAREYLAGKLIDAWCDEHGGKIAWAKAVQIAAIVTKQSDAERDRLLHMDDDKGACGMCGRSDAAIDQARGAANGQD